MYSLSPKLSVTYPIHHSSKMVHHGNNQRVNDDRPPRGHPLVKDVSNATGVLITHMWILRTYDQYHTITHNQCLATITVRMVVLKKSVTVAVSRNWMIDVIIESTMRCIVCIALKRRYPSAFKCHLLSVIVFHVSYEGTPKRRLLLTTWNT